MPNESRIWDGISDIRERTARIETGLQGLYSQVSERCRVREERLTKVEQCYDALSLRMSAIEKRLWIIVGASAVLSTLGTKLLSVLLGEILS
jgi:hypothetical protein